MSIASKITSIDPDKREEVMHKVANKLLTNEFTGPDGRSKHPIPMKQLLQMISEAELEVRPPPKPSIWKQMLGKISSLLTFMFVTTPVNIFYALSNLYIDLMWGWRLEKVEEQSSLMKRFAAFDTKTIGRYFDSRPNKRYLLLNLLFAKPRPDPKKLDECDVENLRKCTHDLHSLVREMRTLKYDAEEAYYNELSKHSMPKTTPDTAPSIPELQQIVWEDVDLTELNTSDLFPTKIAATINEAKSLETDNKKDGDNSHE